MNAAQIKNEIRKLSRLDKIVICRWVDEEAADDLIFRIGMHRAIQIRQEIDQKCEVTSPEGRSSTMKVKTGNPLPPRIPAGVQVREVSEHLAEFVVGCEDDTTIDLTLAEPGNSITVRDKSGALEYLG